MRWCKNLLTVRAASDNLRWMRKVLVIEDDVAMQEVISQQLGGKYEVKSVSEGNAAIAQAGIFQPNVILLDLELIGEMDGRSILDLLRSDEFTSTIPVIVYTNSEDDRREELLQHGANDYISKAKLDVEGVSELIKKYADLPPVPAAKVEGE